MRRVIMDLEADGLLYPSKDKEGNIVEPASKIHCLSYQFEDEEEVKSITDYSRMIQFFKQENVKFVGHNIITYDLPVAAKILGIEVHYLKCIDTLPLSWNLYEHRVIHGLDSWGQDLGVQKPKVDNWKGLTKEEEEILSLYNKNTSTPDQDVQYQELLKKKQEHIDLMVHRCSEDVKINMALWRKQKALLEELYEGDEDKINKLINYLGFKMDCVREQELPECGLYLDLPKIQSGIDRLEVLAQGKVDILKTVMPPTPIIKKKKKPKVFHTKDGSISKLGLGWVEFLKEKGLDQDFEGEVEYVDGYEEPNPNSVDQKKKYLFSLGWVPEHIKFVRDKKTNEVSQIPQIVGKLDKTQVCPSIKKLFAKEPLLEELNGLGIINHRLGILRGFLRDQIGGKIWPSVSAITSSMRMKHRTIVNLPAYNAPYAEEIRSSIIAPPGQVFLGYDLVAGEDRTKRSLIYKYDPDYVIEQSTPGFDPHTDVAILAGLMTKEEEAFYKKIDSIEDKSQVSEADLKEYKRLKDVRAMGKLCNFSATYNIGIDSLARSLNISRDKAKKILDAYWKRNWSVKEYCNNCQVKNVDGRNWILQEVSGHWLPLRADKDRLSATNQSLLAYIFDLWIMFIRQKCKNLMQMHDEGAGYEINEESAIEKRKQIIREALVKVNQTLKLPVEMDCSIQVGQNYAEAH